jgi:hypothetical protein
LGIGDWGSGIRDWAQSPNHNHQSPIPIQSLIKLVNNYLNKDKSIKYICKEKFLNCNISFYHHINEKTF